MYYYVKIENLSKEIRTCDSFSKNDLYVEISFDDVKRRTITKHNTNTPIWNEVFLLEGRNKAMEVSLFEDNNWSSPENIFRETVEILDDGTLKKEDINGVIIEHGYVSVKSAKNQMTFIENISNITAMIGSSFNSLTSEIKSIRL